MEETQTTVPNETTETTEPITRIEELDMDFFTQTGGNFLTLKEGEKLDVIVKKFEKIIEPGNNYNFSKADYKIRMTTMDDKTLDISAWSLLGCIKDAIRTEKVEKLEGLKLHMEHPGRGSYLVVIVKDTE